MRFYAYLIVAASLYSLSVSQSDFASVHKELSLKQHKAVVVAKCKTNDECIESCKCMEDRCVDIKKFQSFQKCKCTAANSKTACKSYGGVCLKSGFCEKCAIDSMAISLSSCLLNAKPWDHINVDFE